MFDVFELTLMVNHACNLRCAYCYTGAKIRRPMPHSTALAAIARALNSLRGGGELQLGFFGGEPLLEADGILRWVEEARIAASAHGKTIACTMTTNGTLTNDAAWRVMTLDSMSLSVSHDGLPEIHDRHRRAGDGSGSSDHVLRTVDQLLDDGVPVNISMVVRPDTVGSLVAGLRFLHSRGVRQISPTLDLWTDWDHEAGLRLEEAIAEAANFWIEQVPGFDISWFSEKTASILDLPSNEIARCGFGIGQVAVSPAGNLYPCERLIEDDQTNASLRLPGDVLTGSDFLGSGFAESAPEGRSAEACDSCAIHSSCATYCRCSNFIRTGDVAQPDGLLCLLDRLCFRETFRVLQARSFEAAVPPLTNSSLSVEGAGHVIGQHS